MFKDRLMKALDQAISYYNDGSDENQSVIKAASDNGFNPDQTQRLVESFNTAKTIVFYKNAEDRSASFETADPAMVIATMFGDRKEEKKASSDNYVDYSYYEQRHPELDKAAEFSAIDPWAGFGDAEFKDEAAEYRDKMAAYQGLVDAKKACDNAALQASTSYDMILQKVAAELSRNQYYNELLYNEFFTYGKTLEKTAGVVVDTILERLPIDKDDLVDTVITNFDRDWPKIASQVREADELLKESACMQALSADLAKQAMSYAFETAVLEEPDELDGFIPKSAGIYDATLDQLANQAGREVSTDVVSTMKGVLGPDTAAQKKFREKARNQYRQLLLERLMVTDPILRGADEESVLRAYETLVELAPEVSLKEDVTRSILREAVTTTAMSPFDAKNYVDLDAAIKKQVAGPKADKEKAK